MFPLSTFLLEQDHEQSRGDDREREVLGGLDRQKGGGSPWEKADFQCCLIKSCPQEPMLQNHVPVRNLAHANKPTELSYFQS